MTAPVAAQARCMGIHDRDDVPEADAGERRRGDRLPIVQIRVEDLPALMKNFCMPPLFNYSLNVRFIASI